MLPVLKAIGLVWAGVCRLRLALEEGEPFVKRQMDDVDFFFEALLARDDLGDARDRLESIRAEHLDARELILLGCRRTAVGILRECENSLCDAGSPLVARSTL